MGEENTVVLHGMWASSVVKRVELALKIKGIPFEYVEEDLRNKSPTLLKHNPVYKQVPVLVHNGKPISESIIILEYIDEAWNNNGPRLLPRDPYRRAEIRFWADFILKQLFEPGVAVVALTVGEAQEKAAKQVREKLKVMEEYGLEILLGEESEFVNGEEMGIVDILMWSVMGGYDILEEVLGIKLVEEEEIPGVLAWLRRLIEHPLGKETFPPKHKIAGLIRFVRNNTLHSQSQSQSQYPPA